MIVRVILSAMSGMFVGAAVLVLGVVASVAFAWSTETRASLPGIFEAWVTDENGLPAINFVPNLWGMLAVVLLVAALFVASALRKRPRDE